MRFIAALLIVLYNIPSSTQKEKVCPEGWKMFDRTKGKWCMNVFAGKEDYATRQAKCRSHGGVLSGVENPAEVKWVNERGVELLLGGTQSYRWILIGGTRRAECMVGWETRPDCLPFRRNTFKWDDDSTVGLNGLQFCGRANPDNLGGHQNCLHMSIQNVPIGDSNCLAGHVDDAACTDTRASGYLCGKKPE